MNILYVCVSCLLSLTSVCLLTVGVKGYCRIWSHSVGLPWTGDRPVADTTWQHNIHKRQAAKPQAGFEQPAVPASEQIVSLISWNTDHLQQLMVAESLYYRTRRFITVFTKDRQWVLWWNRIQSTLFDTVRGEFRPRQTRQLPRAVDLKGRLLSCQSY